MAPLSDLAKASANDCGKDELTQSKNQPEVIWDITKKIERTKREKTEGIIMV